MGKTGRSHRTNSPAGGAGVNVTRRKRMLEQLDEDIRQHLEKETQDNIDRRMSPEDAHYAALRKFGNVALVKEQTHQVWSIAWLEQLLQDLRFGVRMLWRSPGLTVAGDIGDRPGHWNQCRYLLGSERRGAPLAPYPARARDSKRKPDLPFQSTWRMMVAPLAPMAMRLPRPESRLSRLGGV